MSRRFAVAMVMAVTVVSTVGAETLKIDFSRTGGAVEPGYQGYFATHENPITFTTQYYTAFGTNVAVQPTWVATAVAEAMQMINRTGDPYSSDRPDMIADWIGTDNRNLAGDPLTLIVSGLPAGIYNWRSYHHDTHDQTGQFDVTVDDAAGTHTTVNVDITNSNGGDNVVDFADISVFEADIVSDGNPVTLAFHCRATTPTAAAFFVMNGFELEKIDTSLASDPIPGSEDAGVSLPIILQWTPGDSTAATNGHRILMSESFTDVNEGAPAAVQGIVSTPMFDTSGLNLQFDTTYYWRVDQSSTPGGPWNNPGKVWSFTVESYNRVLPGTVITATASSSASVDEGPEKTVDGSGLTGDLHDNLDTKTMWLSAMTTESTWIQYEFDKVYSLHQMLVWNYNGTAEPSVGFGVKDVTIECSTDGTTWTTLGTTHQFNKAPIPSTASYAPGTTIDFAGTPARYVRITVINNWGGLLPQYGLSEVRFYYVPVWAREPQPADGATGVALDADLKWQLGRGAVTHDVYFSTSRKAVLEGTAPVLNLSANSHDPGALSLDTTYYWRVDEVNSTATPSVWEGSLWSFTTQDALVVDDMEHYGDANTPGPPPPDGSRVWYTWKDGSGWTNPQPGYAGNGSGAFIGHGDSPYVETGIVHGGGASLPFYYVNDSAGGPYYSEAIANISDLAIGSDWTAGGAKSLSLWFYGDVNNVASATDQMYVKVNGVKVSYPGDMVAVTQTLWHEWNIDLTEFSGVDLTSVTTIAIGFGNQSNTTTSGGSGIVFFDDIRLYPSRCRAEIQQPGADLNDDCVVNLLDAATMAGQWLTDGHLVNPASPGTANLVGHWEFDGNVNDSAGTAVGSVVGEPVYVTGYADQAIKLDGVEDFALIEGTWDLTSYSMSVWFRSDGGSGSRDIFSAYDPNIAHGIFLEVQSNGTLRYLHRAPLGTGGGTNIYTSGSVVDGMWHHAGLVKAADAMAAYLDGELVGSQADDTVFGRSLNFIAMGVLKHEDSAGLSRFFYGAIDDARLYNRALSAEEVAWLAGETATFSIPSDTNVDGAVDFKDFSSLTAGWLDEALWP